MAFFLSNIRKVSNDWKSNFIEPLMPRGERGGGSRNIVIHEFVNELMHKLHFRQWAHSENLKS